VSGGGHGQSLLSENGLQNKHKRRPRIAGGFLRLVRAGSSGRGGPERPAGLVPGEPFSDVDHGFADDPDSGESCQDGQDEQGEDAPH